MGVPVTRNFSKIPNPRSSLVLSLSSPCLRTMASRGIAFNTLLPSYNCKAARIDDQNSLAMESVTFVFRSPTRLVLFIGDPFLPVNGHADELLLTGNAAFSWVEKRKTRISQAHELALAVSRLAPINSYPWPGTAEETPGGGVLTNHEGLQPRDAHQHPR